MQKKLGGLDIGTTGCKLCIYGEDGKLCHTAYRPYESERNSSKQELDGNAVIAAVREVFTECRDAVGKIDAVGVTSFGESFVMLDEKNRVLMPTMLYTDKRGAEYAPLFDTVAHHKITGMMPHGMYSLPKIMWIKNHKPEIYKQCRRILLYQDFVVYMLTGVAQIDYSLATRTMAFDIQNKCWSREIFDKAGVDMGLMSVPVLGGTPAGYITDASLGMTDTLIVTGCHDQVAAVMGSNVTEPGVATDGSGTVECTTPIFREIPENNEFYDGGYVVVPHILDNVYMTYAFSYTGGAALKWFRDKFAPDMSYKELDKAAGDTPTGILVLPYFAGAATPYMDENATAAVVGLTLGTSKTDFYRAILEGVAYEMRVNLERVERGGIKIEKYYATGGGAASPKWLQIKADILGRPFVALDVMEAGTVGTVILTGKALGVFATFEEGFHRMAKEKETYYPDPVRHAEYTAYYEKYKNLYAAVKPLM